MFAVQADNCNKRNKQYLVVGCRSASVYIDILIGC